jgi:hypothetical protein
MPNLKNSEQQRKQLPDACRMEENRCQLFTQQQLNIHNFKRTQKLDTKRTNKGWGCGSSGTAPA